MTIKKSWLAHIGIMNMIIKVKGFKKQYLNHLVILEDMSITKRVNLLIGQNGSGKSTLLKAIANMIKYEGEITSEGKVCIMNEVVSYPLDLDLKTFLIELNNISVNKVSEEVILKLLTSFNLEDKQDEKLQYLSKGMAAKVNIVQCLMEEADIYLLDEPFSGLDKEGVKCLVNYIKKDSSIFIISTHLDNDFKEICDEVFYL